MDDIISMSYGNGGEKTSKLINEIMVPAFSNNMLNTLSDGAIIKESGKLAFSTDSFVIDPYFFPGGDIGKLSICGTVNDLLMCGSIPKYLSMSLILEEGFKISDLKSIINSASKVANDVGVKIVTGDTKVVDKGHGHGIYINTAGIGQKIEELDLGKDRIQVGDKVIVTGDVGNHGISILCARENLLEQNVLSDCAPLVDIIDVVKKYGKEIKIMRDPTRGGIATTLNEFIEDTDYSIEIIEDKLPIDSSVKVAAELLGIDLLYSANEGKCLLIVSDDCSEEVLEDLRKIDMFKRAQIIGEVVDYTKGNVLLKTPLGSRRILDKLNYDILPRIC